MSPESVMRFFGARRGFFGRIRSGGGSCDSCDLSIGHSLCSRMNGM